MPKEQKIKKVEFSEIDLSDPFFDSLRLSYGSFDAWFTRKGNQSKEAYVMFGENGFLQAFLYLKTERGAVTDIDPPLNTDQCLKIGTFKINAHGTRLGERFVKKVFDEALVKGFRHIYTTVFPDQEPLIEILRRYGFFEYGAKATSDGVEKVFVKDFTRISNDTLLDYPVVNIQNR